MHRLRRASWKSSRLNTQDTRTQRSYERKHVGENHSVLTEECVHARIKHFHLQLLVGSP
jgi:hypothetical protein